MAEVVANIVEVYIFRRVAEEVQYLLLKRSASEEIHPGIWQIVTGRVEEGERATDGALRELREETGLEPKAFWTLPGVNPFYSPRTDQVYLCPMFAAEVASGKDPKLSEEHQMFGWFDFDRARSFLVWPSQKSGLDLVQTFIVSDSAVGEITRIF